MSFCPTRFLWVLALSAGVVSASAQQTIIYSKPAGVNPGKANSFMGDSRSLNAGSYNAPRSILNVQPDLPLPAPAYQSPWSSAAQAAADKHNNWALLTPEQILGVKSVNEIMGIKPKDDTSGLSLEQKFLLRQRQPAGANPADNAAALFGRDGSNPFLNDNSDARSQAGAFAPNARPLDASQPNSFSSLQKLFRPANAGNFSPGGAQGPNPNQQSIWASGFAQPPQPKISPGQIANMEQFRAMLNNDPAPSAPVVKPVYSAPGYSAPGSSMNSFFDQQPKINPAGRSFTALEDTSTRPKGLTPLPGITGPVPKPDTKRPSWKAQLPPWLSEGQ